MSIRCACWLLSLCVSALPALASPDTAGGWSKWTNNPVLGGKLGTCFDIAVRQEAGVYRMWFSWRPKKSIALTESTNGVDWSEPVVVLGPNERTDWESDINRPSVVKIGSTYHLWYTGQARGHSAIGHATSTNGVHWTRTSDAPVLSPAERWEQVAVMCPHVLWDDARREFRMWYSGGEQYEPNAVGYATSSDGVAWKKHAANPVFTPGEARWERDRVTGCQVIRDGNWHYMLYIGFADKHFAQIGLARSRDGLTNWERHPSNPLIRSRVVTNSWDFDAVYKPYAVFDGQRWLLWYNGRKGSVEQMGLATHPGRALWPPDSVALPAGVPAFDCPDADIVRTYNFRWSVLKEHIRETFAGRVITEFLPDVPWAGKFNTISCAAGHHLYEARWLHDTNVAREYSTFWFRGGGEPRRYSFWAADAVHAVFLAQHDAKWATNLLDDLIANFRAWEKTRRDTNGLFWQIDDRDGMEVSIGGSGYRATINSYMYGDAQAISRIAAMAGRRDVAQAFAADAARIKGLVQATLWDSSAEFFKVLPRREGARLADVRELHGYTPWYFNLPDAKYSVAWRQLMDPQGFFAPFGPTTAERRHPRYGFKHNHECLWNGPSWPYATAVTLTAMANLLNQYDQRVVTASDYVELLRTYARSHQLRREDGEMVPWIDEDLDPDTGEWIARNILEKRGVKDRGKDYNHSSFCDLVITGLAGLRPRGDDLVEVNPLVPEGAWDYFALTDVPYHGKRVSILWDKTGARYGQRGLRVMADGKEIAKSPRCERVMGRL